MDLEHERARLHAGVDSFVDSLVADDGEEYEGISIDTFGIVTMCVWEDNTKEAPFYWFEARRSHVQLGLIRAVTIDQESDYRNADED